MRGSIVSSPVKISPFFVSCLATRWCCIESENNVRKAKVRRTVSTRRQTFNVFPQSTVVYPGCFLQQGQRVPITAILIASVTAGQLRIHVRDKNSRCGLALVETPEVFERREQPVDADGRAGRRHFLSEKPHYQVIITTTAENGAELGRIEKHRFEDRAGVVRQSPRDTQVEDGTVVIIAKRVQLVGDFLNATDFLVRILDGAEEFIKLREYFFAVLVFIGKVLFDLIDLPPGKLQALDRVA